MAKLGNFLAQGTTRYFQPPAIRAAAVYRAEADIQKRLATLVGLVAFGLPIAMAAGAVLGGSCFRDSISHFYYAQFLGPVFVGLLIFIGGFLIAYTGEHWLEDAGSVVAGLGACFVAVFPTSGNGCEGEPRFLSRVFVEYTPTDPPTVAPVDGRGFFQLFPHVENLHAYAAGVLFIYLGLYCLVVLKRVVPARHMRGQAMIATKRRRNILYSLCGIVILACVATMGAVGFLAGPGFLLRWKAANLTFAVETAALWAFGLAWIAKGRRLGWLNDPAP